MPYEIPSSHQEHLGRPQYNATQMRTGVRIVAVGFNPTAGYSNYFERLPIDKFPPEYAFYSVKPDGPAADVVTPFQVMVEFLSFENVPSVTIHDADGRHDIPVDQANKLFGKDGPFPMFT